MLKTGKNYPFTDISKIKDIDEYRIGINDLIELTVSTNNGAEIFSKSIASMGGELLKPFTVPVEYDGTIKIPVIGRLNVLNMTQRELELLLEQRYSQYYVDAFITAKITNKFIFYMTGDGGATRKVRIENARTTLLEVIAQNNGIGFQGKSDRIKIVRGDKKTPEVYLIDLSSMSNVQLADIVIQAGDIIVVEARNDYFANFAQRVSAYVIALNFIFTTYIILSR